MITIVLDPYTHGDRGPLYDVTLDGKVIVSGAHDPEHEAARAMQALGLTGPFQTTDKTGRIRMQYPSIEETAKWTMKENAHGNPTFEIVRYVPMPKELIAARRAAEGRLQPPCGSQDALNAVGWAQVPADGSDALAP